MTASKERYVSDVLAEMSRPQLEAINVICDFASGKLRTKTPEAISAAELIEHRLDDEQQKVAYYLIGRAEADRSTPIILNLYL